MFVYRSRLVQSIALISLLTLGAPPSRGQDRLPQMPNYERYVQMRRALSGSARLASLRVAWLEDGAGFEYLQNGQAYRYNVQEGRSEPIPQLTRNVDGPRRRFRQDGALERGRQFASATSPDGKRKAYYKDNNLWLSDADGKNAFALTQDGDKAKRIKYGTASWVYGEELYQTTAMWWSPDSRKVAFYRFDESKVPDYYLALDQLQIQSRVDTEPYPKAGAPNPIVDLFFFDVETKKTVRADIRDGKPFEDHVVGHYAYNIRWSPNGKELLFNRTNRLQNIMEIAAADPDTGKCRVIVRETWVASWTDNTPKMQYLQDQNRFILFSERTGFKNLYLYDLSGKLHATLTQHPFEVEEIVRVDEEKGVVYYMARSGDNPYKLQLHRVRLDGTEDKRLTDPTLHHEVQISPTGARFVDTAQAHNKPPVVRLVDAEGKTLKNLAASETGKLDELNVPRAELFTFKAADGATDLYGMLFKPSNFDPKRKYPLLVSVYGGPESGMVSERFAMPDSLTEMGFLVAYFDGRGTNGRGKKFKDAVYGKLGVTEIDDQAAGVKYLRQREYVDGGRVGIHGVSYGGYASAMCLLRYPDVFQAASASSSVTDWRNYDTIYTERYMGLPTTNEAGYNAGSAMTYAQNLKGRLMLFFGTADNNVHPSNTFQLVAALQRAGKSFELQAAPDQGHTGLSFPRMMEFFQENLVLRPASPKSVPMSP